MDIDNKFSQIIEENKKAIRESEVRKQQALEQFRDQINKHPFIKKCRKDDSFLLQFLRTRKYSIDSALKSFEKFFLLRKNRWEWFDVSPTSVDVIKSLIRNKFYYILKDYDKLGRTIIINNANEVDLLKINSNEIFNVTFIGAAAALERELCQIVGFVYIINYIDTPLDYFTKFSVSELVDWVKSIESLPGRFKKFIAIGLPPFAVKILNIVKLAMSEKQRDRLFLLSSENELCQHIDASILPERFGGSQSEEKIIEDFIEMLDQNVEILRSINDFEIDEEMAKLQNQTTQAVGSFRKLEID